MLVNQPKKKTSKNTPARTHRNCTVKFVNKRTIMDFIFIYQSDQSVYLKQISIVFGLFIIMDVNPIYCILNYRLFKYHLHIFYIIMKKVNFFLSRIIEQKHVTLESKCGESNIDSKYWNSWITSIIRHNNDQFWIAEI